MSGQTRAPILLLTLLVLAALACGVGTQVPPPTPTPLSPPVETATPVQLPTAVDTPTPVDSPTPTPTSTPAATATSPVVTVHPAGGDVACRFGPALEYSAEGVLPFGTTVPALARNGSSSWVRIEHLVHPGWNCWLPVADLVVEGNLATVPVEGAPTAFVESVEVDASPSEATVPGCVFPYTFDVDFWITVNGPVTVKFQRSRDDGSKAPVETVVYTTFGRYAFMDIIRAGSVGEHWFQVEVVSPNSVVDRSTVMAKCP